MNGWAVAAARPLHILAGLMLIYLIRHADPDYPNNTITPAGHLEARALGERMGKVGLNRIYCSPLGRARDTMRYIAEKIGLTAQIEPWTAELTTRLKSGPCAGNMIWDLHGEIIREKQPYPSAENWQSIPDLGDAEFKETLDCLRNHSDEFIARHGYRREGGRYRIVKPNREKIALFCHGGFGLAWLAILLEIPFPLVWSGFWLPPSSVTTILFDERSAQWAVPRCVGVGDVSHLYQAGLPVQPSGIKANFE
jgi:broad specificity phosphatase PhoE